MITNSFLKPYLNQSPAYVLRRLNTQNLKQQKPNSILQEEGFEDDFLHGDFTKNLIISTLNNWSKLHFRSIINKQMPFYRQLAN